MAVYRAKHGPKARRFACIDTVGKLIGLGMVESEAIANAADGWRKCTGGTIYRGPNAGCYQYTAATGRFAVATCPGTC